MTKEELLEEAKRRYPIGTRFYSTLRNNENEVYCLNFRWIDKSYDLQNINLIQNKKGGWLYEDGRWAEIISTPNQDMEDLKVC